MKRVMPRVTWTERPDIDGYEVHITLDNAEEEYDFAFEVTRAEIAKSRHIDIEKCVYGAHVLMADYERRHGVTI